MSLTGWMLFMDLDAGQIPNQEAPAELRARMEEFLR